MSADIEYKLASGAAFLSVSQIVALLLGVAFSVLIARLIGPENYGIVGISLTFPTLLVNLLELGTSNVLIKYAASSSQLRKTYVWSTIIARLALGVLGSITTYIFADSFANVIARPHIAGYIRVLSLYVFAFTLVTALSSVFTGFRRYAVSGSMIILQYALRGLLAVILIITGYGVFGVVSSYSIAYTLLGLTYLLLLFKSLGKPIFSLKALHDVLKLSFPLFIASVAGMFVSPVTNALLAHNASDFDIGNYSVGAVSLTPVSVTLSSVSAATISVLSMVENTEELRKRASAVSIYGSAVLLFLVGGYVSVLEPIIRILYGLGYLDSPYYAIIISIGHLVSATLAGSVLSSYLIIIGATRWNSLSGIVGSITTIALSAVLIPALKARGAAISAAMGLASSSILTYIIVRRRFHVEIPLKTVLRILMPPLAGLLCSRLALLHLEHYSGVEGAIIRLFTAGSVYTLVYLTSLPLFLDKNIIGKIIEFSCKLRFFGRLICALGKPYLRILSIKTLYSE